MRRLLYLHGVGDDGTRLDWFESLGIDRGRLVAPDYSDLLRTPPADLADPGRVTPTTSSPTDQHRRDYRSGQVRLHEQLQTFGSTSFLPRGRRGFGRVPDFIDAIAEHLVVGLVYETLSHYSQDETRRRAIRKRVTDSLPNGGCDLVIVGHSLGALVALDLISHLPDNIEVELLVTAASTLARRQVPDETLQLRHSFPYDRVGVWLNVYNPSDAVTRGVPIGPRFPQVIDVSVAGSFVDHALAACVADPGVAAVIRAACQDPAKPTQPTVVGPSDQKLHRAEVLHLAVTQMTMQMEDLLAAQTETTPEDLSKFHEARRLVHESFKMGSDYGQTWDQDHRRILQTGTAEKDLPAVLVRLVTADPLRMMQVHIPDEIDQLARVQAAVDVGLPPSWITLAERCLEQVGQLLPLVGLAGTAATRDSGDSDDQELSTIGDIRDSLHRTLSGLTLTVGGTAERTGLADLRSVVSELLARALVAHRIGTELAGTEERETLSRLMAELGRHRARIDLLPATPIDLADQLQEFMGTVARSLDWLAGQGIGLHPRDSQVEPEFV